MSYIEGFVVAVPRANKDAYRKHAVAAAPFFKKLGATRMVDNWGDDVPDGKVTDYKGAVKANADEKIVYSWIEWPSKEIRDKGWDKAMKDPRMQSSEMPFDGKRMIYGGFSTMLDM